MIHIITTGGHRDWAIEVHWENIQRGREINFYTYERMNANGANYSYKLDFSSIMLYGSYAFSKNGKPTITKRNGYTFRASRSGLSALDIKGVANMYAKQRVYENDEFYTIGGVTVLRYRDRWYFKTNYGWKVVERRNGYWWYV